ncbi:hypothetical protein [Kribbella sp. NPDC051718]|uniref:hypothetical protein n=1 Tax=Kribbella sp. NPDC051718 TaxID=3155168 RepID=UPI00342D6EC9
MMRTLLKAVLGGGRHRGPRQLTRTTPTAEAQHAGGNDWFATFEYDPIIDDEIPVARLMGHDSWRYL